jgi:hypothetical protein
LQTARWPERTIPLAVITNGEMRREFQQADNALHFFLRRLQDTLFSSMCVLKFALLIALCDMISPVSALVENFFDLPSCPLGGMSQCGNHAKEDPNCTSTNDCKYKTAGSCKCMGARAGGVVCGAGYPMCGDGGECFDCNAYGNRTGYGCNSTGTCPPAPPYTPPKDCSIIGSQTNCTKLDLEAYCGVSSFKTAVFTDGSGCSCNWGYDYDSKTHHCHVRT